MDIKRDSFGRFIKGNCIRKGKSHSEETKQKIREKLKGKVSVGTLKNLREMGLARRGKPISREIKDRISEAKKGKNTGADSWNWTGGRTKHSYGYILIYSPEHPFCDTQKHIREHRLVIEKQIGRYLLSNEEGHHLNNIKDDNRPENLMAFISKSAHRRFEKGGTVKPSEIIFDGRKLKEGE